MTWSNAFTLGMKSMDAFLRLWRSLCRTAKCFLAISSWEGNKFHTQTSAKKLNDPALVNGALLTWEISCNCFEAKICERCSAFPQNLEGKKKNPQPNRKNRIWLNMFPFEKIHHSEIKCKTGSVIVLRSNSPLAWLSLKRPLSNRVCGHGAGWYSCLQYVLTALLIGISSDCSCMEKIPSLLPARKAVQPGWSKNQKYWSFKSYY